MARVKGWSDGAEFGDTLFWSSVTAGVTAVTTQKASGSYSYEMTTSLEAVTKVMATALSEFYFKIRVMQTTPEIETGTVQFIRFFSAAQVMCRVDFDQESDTLVYYTGSTLRGYGSIPITAGEWKLLEIHYLVHDTTGVFEVRIDGVQDFIFNGDTKPSTETTVNSLTIYNGVSAYYTTWYLDDIGLNDTTGTVNNSWVGAGRYHLLKPNGNGDVTQLVGSDGNQTDNYALVDEIPSDGDTSYVVSSGIGQYDLYTLEDTTALAGVSISGIWMEARAKETIAEGGEISFMIKSAGVMHESSHEALTESYSRLTTDVYTVDPVASGALSTSLLDGYQLGPIIR